MTGHPFGACPTRYVYDEIGTRYRITSVTTIVLGHPIFGPGCDVGPHAADPADNDDSPEAVTDVVDQVPGQGELWEGP